MLSEETVSSEWTRNKWIPVDYRKKELELQFTSRLANGRMWMIPKDHRASAFFNVADVNFLCTVACMVATLFDLRLLLRVAQFLELAATFKEKIRQGICRTYFAWKRAKFIHCGYAVLDRLWDAPESVIDVLIL